MNQTILLVCYFLLLLRIFGFSLRALARLREQDRNDVREFEEEVILSHKFWVPDGLFEGCVRIAEESGLRLSVWSKIIIYYYSHIAPAIDTYVLIMSIGPIFTVWFGVAAFNPAYALNAMVTYPSMLMVQATVTDVIATKMQDALGTDPAKNWQRMQTIFVSKNVASEHQGWIFGLCHFSSNPAVWNKIMNAMIADVAVPVDASTGWIVKVKELIADGTIEWKKGGMPSAGKIMPQRILNANPPLAASTWCAVTPNKDISVKAFLSQRWSVAMDIDATLKNEAENYQKDFVTNVLGKTWDSKFIGVVKRSKFFFADFNNQSGTAVVSRYGSSTFDRTQLVAWLNKQNGLSLTP